MIVYDIKAPDGTEVEELHDEHADLVAKGLLDFFDKPVLDAFSELPGIELP